MELDKTNGDYMKNELEKDFKEESSMPLNVLIIFILYVLIMSMIVIYLFVTKLN